MAPLVLLSIHPSYHRTEHMCTRRHACAHARSPGVPAVRTFPGHTLMTSLTTLKNISSANRTEVIAAETTSRPLGTNAYMNTHARTRTFTRDAGRQVAPLVLLSVHPSYHRTDARNDCVPEHTHAHMHIHTRCWTPGGTSGVAVHSSFLPSH